MNPSFKFKRGFEAHMLGVGDPHHQEPEQEVGPTVPDWDRRPAESRSQLSFRTRRSATAGCRHKQQGVNAAPTTGSEESGDGGWSRGGPDPPGWARCCSRRSQDRVREPGPEAALLSLILVRAPTELLLFPGSGWGSCCRVEAPPRPCPRTPPRLWGAGLPELPGWTTETSRGKHKSRLEKNQSGRADKHWARGSGRSLTPSSGPGGSWPMWAGLFSPVI